MYPKHLLRKNKAIRQKTCMGFHKLILLLIYKTYFANIFCQQLATPRHNWLNYAGGGLTPTPPACWGPSEQEPQLPESYCFLLLTAIHKALSCYTARGEGAGGCQIQHWGALLSYDCQILLADLLWKCFSAMFDPHTPAHLICPIFQWPNTFQPTLLWPCFLLPSENFATRDRCF